jgi:hypothetical protein
MRCDTRLNLPSEILARSPRRSPVTRSPSLLATPPLPNNAPTKRRPLRPWRSANNIPPQSNPRIRSRAPYPPRLPQLRHVPPPPPQALACRALPVTTKLISDPLPRRIPGQNSKQANYDRINNSMSAGRGIYPRTRLGGSIIG